MSSAYQCLLTFEIRVLIIFFFFFLRLSFKYLESGHCLHMQSRFHTSMTYHSTTSQCLLTFETQVQHFYLTQISYYFVLFYLFLIKWSYNSNYKQNTFLSTNSLSLFLVRVHIMELGVKIPVANQS